MKAHQLRAKREGQPAPSGPEWIWGEEALERSAEALSKLPAPFLLVGEAKLVNPLRKRLLGAWTEAGLDVLPLAFPENNECSEARAKSIVDAATHKDAKTLIGLGGGKCIDSVKWAGLMSGLPVVTVPTSAATCACATQVVVAHSDAGEVLDLIDLAAPPRLCIADFALLASAPRETLAAGMADTLAKWGEWQAVEDPAGPGADEAGRAMDIVLDASSSLERVWEASLRLSAEASNLGGAPAAAAHSFCAGISLLPESRSLLHGAWVGLGLRFQSNLLGRDDAALRAWLQGLGLPDQMPLKLPDPGLVGTRILREDESIHQMQGVPVDLPRILDALKAVSE